MARAKKVEAEAPRETKQITIDKAEFVQTRDALITSWLTLEGALRDATRAYIAHSNAVLGGTENLDINQLDLTSFLEARNVLAIADAAGEKGKIKRAKRAPRDPNAPKRPLTAYLLWLGDNRSKIHDELGPEQKRGQISSEGTKQWHALPEATKQIYKDTYNKNNEEYIEKMKEYKATVGDLPVDDVEEEAAADADEPMEDAKTPAAETDVSTSSDSSSDSDSDDGTPVPPKEPTPPPVKTPKSAAKGGRKKAKAAGEPPASSPPLPASSPVKGKDFVAVNGSKRKAKAEVEAPVEEPKPKRGRKNAAPASTPAEVPASTPATAKKEKKTKKGRKSVGGDA
ncbi:hypothetical protein MBLNU459_g5583t1 [Dothideomycetes sp. NU459]